MPKMQEVCFRHSSLGTYCPKHVLLGALSSCQPLLVIVMLSAALLDGVPLPSAHSLRPEPYAHWAFRSLVTGDPVPVWTHRTSEFDRHVETGAWPWIHAAFRTVHLSLHTCQM